MSVEGMNRLRILILNTPVFLCSNLSVITLQMISYIRISSYTSKYLNDVHEERQVWENDPQNKSTQMQNHYYNISNTKITTTTTFNLQLL